MSENSYEKELTTPERIVLTQDEKTIISEINSALRANVGVNSGKTDLQLLTGVSNGEKPYGEDRNNKFSGEITTFLGENASIQEKFTKLKIDLKARMIVGQPYIIDETDLTVFDTETELVDTQKINEILDTGTIEQKKTLYQTLERLVLEQHNQLFDRTELEEIMIKICDSITTNTLAPELQKDTESFLINLCSLHNWMWIDANIFGKLADATDKILENMLTNKKYTCANIEFIISKITRSQNEFEPEKYNQLYTKLQTIFEKNPSHDNLYALNMLKFKEEVTPANALEKFDQQVNLYVKKYQLQSEFINPLGLSNQCGMLQSKLMNGGMEQFLINLTESQDISQKAVILSMFLTQARWQRTENPDFYNQIKSLIVADSDLAQITKLILYTDISSLSHYTELCQDVFGAETILTDTDQQSVSEVIKNKTIHSSYDGLLQSLLMRNVYPGQSNQNLLSTGVNVISESADIATILSQLKSYIEKLQYTQINLNEVGLNTTILSQKIDSTQDPSEKKLLWIYSVCLFGKEGVQNLSQFDTQQIFGLSQEKFIEMYDVSPHWELEKRIFLNDLIAMQALHESSTEQQVVSSIFDNYNITRFSRYGDELLHHLYENRNTPTGKPVYPIFTSKKDYNGAVDSGLRDNNESGLLNNKFFDSKDYTDLLAYYDIRIFEPGQNPDQFFPKMDNFYNNYVGGGGTRENPNVTITGHGYEKGIELKKSEKSEKTELIYFQDKEFITRLGKYIKLGNITLVSCSTGGENGGEENIAQAIAKWGKCKVYGPVLPTGSPTQTYNSNGEVIFSDFGVGTAIYDGRKNTEALPDQVFLSEGTVFDILENDGTDAKDFTLIEGEGENFNVIEESENIRKINVNGVVLTAEKILVDGKYKLSITGGSEEIAGNIFKIPYATYSDRLPRTFVDRDGNESISDNNFRVESNGIVEINTQENLSNESIETNQITLYPNPCTDNIYIKFASNQKFTQTDIEIFDISGKQILSKKIAENEESIDTSALAAGPYILKRNNGTTGAQTKFIKQ